MHHRHVAGGATAEFAVHLYVTANNGDSITSSTVVDVDDAIVEMDESNTTASDTRVLVAAESA